MMGVASLLLVSVLVCCSVEKGCCLGAPVLERFPLGVIGCLFTDELCGPQEKCVDDRLFGTCQRLGRAHDLYKYLLDRGTLKVLQGEILGFIQQGLSWSDPYTQCMLQNVLVAYRERRDFDKFYCSDVASWSTDTEDEITQVLRKLFRFYDDQSLSPLPSSEVLVDPASDDIVPLDNLSDREYQYSNTDLDTNSQKRDEFLKIHKYFDPSQPKWKRMFDPSPSTDPYNSYLSGLEDERVSSYEPYDTRNEINNNYADFSQEDLSNLQYYLQALQRISPDAEQSLDEPEDIYPSSQLGEDSFPSEEESSDEGSDEGGGAFWTSPRVGSSSEEKDEVWPNTEQPLPGVDLSVLDASSPSDNSGGAVIPVDTSDSLPDDTFDQGEKQEEIDNVISENGLSPRYAKLLADLLQDKVHPSKLSDGDLDRLTKIVDSLLKDLANREDEIVGGDITDITNNEDDQLLPLGQIFTAEDMSSEGDGDGNLPSEETYMVKKDESPALEDVPDAPDAADAPDEPKEDKVNKAASSEDKAASDDVGVVDVHYAFITVDKDINVAQAKHLMDGVATLLNVLPSDFRVKDVTNGKVTFLISPERLQRQNASSIANAAYAHRDDLHKLTGLTLVNAGVGGQDGQVQIDLLANGGITPKYFVLTFVLCGCIAGVLIAVVVLYLVKRHSRSKEKLNQLATQGDGAEASNDYQDLCRQRMQSKSSEKPEPLHAAGRIGSVSESQVRSPSSRSSTSSWSEEPVSSNMDISTGHIVLSYMEDHLKNKDRLSREWDALEAYEADPCSTIVASDPTNTRKNRYGDILPYDHSRVVLADASNVSGSDYINATTITDHDPRNPAYLSSQGPLPHTVADFWQMVWEQGSVVIVMLTKLTENGAAMCHRYWPEEGSDLYHIYEVHLVSEHIWCDDYLVRSFYLKNLQTNETRTVTQFHFLTWPDNKVPGSVKALLDFRRKVNKSYRGRSCPIAVHCSDGAGRTGTYTLIDMVLNRLAKGAKEIDIAATLEHIRDQRMGTVKTKEQFEFALAAVAEEVHAILKSLPQ